VIKMKCETVSKNQWKIRNSCNCVEHNHITPKAIEKYLKSVNRWDNLSTKEKNFIKNYKHNLEDLP